MLKVYYQKMKKYDSLTDEELTDLFKSGDREAFTRIFHTYWAPLVLHANKFLRDEDMAQDLVQDVFAWMVKFPEKWQIRTALKYYLYSAVRGRVLNAIEHEKVKNVYFEKLNDFVPVIHADLEYELKELSDIIDAEILKMPKGMREIFNMSRKQHLSHKEIADMLDVSEHTVKMQIKRALQVLRRNQDIKNYTAIIAFAMAVGK